jgi:choline dehydrogenase-like flavoprotein
VSGPSNPIVVAPTGLSIAELGLSRRAERGTISTEVVVIGTGAGGAVAGTALSKKHKVLFLEAGGAYPRSEFQKKDWLWAFEHLYQRRGAQLSSGGNVRIAVMSGRAVGGSTVINSAICFRPPEERLREWQAITGAAHLAPDAMRPFVDDIWRRIGVVQTHLGVGRRHNDLLRIGVERLGGVRHAWMDRNTPGCVGCGACNIGCPAGGKASVDRAILPEAVTRGALVHTHASAEHIVIEGGRATRVLCHVLGDDGSVVGELEVKADLVIVAGSALRSPVLLKKSGIGGPEAGNHLAVHSALGVFAMFPDPVNMWNGATQGYYAHAPDHPDALVETSNLGADQLFALYARAGHGGLDVISKMKNIALAGGMIRDPQTGRVTVGSDGDMRFSYDVTEKHLEAFRAGMRLTARAYFAAGATSVSPTIGDLRFYATEAEALGAIDAVRSPEDLVGVYGSHPQGSCRMGPRDGKNRGVVDENARVHGTENVYVMDGSIFPTTLGVNPQVTIMSLASMLSARLIA